MSAASADPSATAPLYIPCELVGVQPRLGRPKVRKSSRANRLANKKRSIVSDVAGTTRDAIDTMIEWKGTPIRLVDTAGL